MSISFQYLHLQLWPVTFLPVMHLAKQVVMSRRAVGTMAFVLDIVEEEVPYVLVIEDNELPSTLQNYRLPFFKTVFFFLFMQHPFFSFIIKSRSIETKKKNVIQNLKQKSSQLKSPMTLFGSFQHLLELKTGFLSPLKIIVKRQKIANHYFDANRFVTYNLSYEKILRLLRLNLNELQVQKTEGSEKLKKCYEHITFSL